LKLVFMGTPEFALPSLHALIADGHAIAAAVTATDEPRGRGRKVSCTPVKEAALSAGISVLQPASLKHPEFGRMIRDLAPDMIVVVAFRILPPEIFSIPRLGSINLHASLLPAYRGAAPINRAIMNGETETGVTTFFLRERVDTGDMLLQASVPVGGDETAGELHDKLALLGARVLRDTVRGVEDGALQARPQDNRLASSAPKIRREDCRIRWELSGKRVHDHVRGLSPQPGAWTTLGGASVKIISAREMSVGAPSGQAGAVVESRRRLVVACGGGAVEIRRLKLEGRKEMSAEEFLRGRPLGSTDRFV